VSKGLEKPVLTFGLSLLLACNLVRNVFAADGFANAFIAFTDGLLIEVEAL